MATRASISAQADANLLKDITKLIHRIERILVPTNSMVHSTMGQKLDGLIATAKTGSFFVDVNKFPVNDLIGYEVRHIEALFRKVAFPKLEAALFNIVSEGNPEYQLPYTVQAEIEMEKQAHNEKFEKAASKERVRRLQKRNGLPVIPGKWRKEPYGTRAYEYLTDYSVTANIGEEEGRQLREQLVTPLNGFLGQAYNYDDHDLTEEWMVTFQDKSAAGPSEDDVIRTQLESLLEIMMVAVQDRVCTETGVLQRLPLKLGEDIKEVPVWGIDCYTRRMVEMAIEDRVPAEQRNEKTIKKFIERALLPTINDQAPEHAHDMTYTILAILKNERSSAVDRLYAEAVHSAIQEYTIDVFRIHPKGTGVVCINPAGIQPHVFLTSYLGELYPSYRWCERLDVVEQAQQTFELKPTLPDFWNILLERPRQDPNGYGLLYVDASRKANNASSCSHSCDSNCTSAVVARNGKLAIALTTNRYVHYGEELTMDYYSITTSDMEWRAAICLCGSPECRGSFLHYATQDDLQQVLNQSCGPLWRYASLLRACSERPPTKEDLDVLVRHGMQSAALGANPPDWVKKFAVDNLRFVEFERKALPCALLRSKDGSKSLYTYSAADMDARSVMEQRLQSMVCCFSMVQQVILRNELNGTGSNAPLVPYFPADAVSRVWDKLLRIPLLLKEHLLEPAQAAVRAAQAAAGKDKKEVVVSASPNSSASSKENAPLAVAAAPSAAEAAEKSLPQKRAVVAQIIAAQAEVSLLLSEKPKGLSKLREICLSLRAALKTIELLSTARARIVQLCDVLLFWAYTTNFSTVQLFGAVESGPIEVYARELGNNIPRSKVFKSFRSGEIALRSREKVATETPDTKATAAVVETRPDGLYWASDSASDGPAFHLPISADAKADGVAVVSDTASDSAFSNASDIVAATIAHIIEQAVSPFEARSELEVEATAASVQAAPAIVSDADNSEAASEIANSDAPNTETSELVDFVDRAEPENAHLQIGHAGSRNYYLESDETVYVGTKKYSELFTFWQLMGWFNAGTDQKIEAPDLFGCVELPEPLNCFGVAEVPYGPKQREALVALLRNDKSQTMSWPALLKQSFTLPSTANTTPLYGSPMLDGALGQVGVVSRVIAGLLEGYEAPRAADGKKKKTGASGKSGGDASAGSASKKGDVAQFDSILPPELPTSWVQCELCRQWRRVAWFVNSEALPDLWECHMNTWDPDNATCSAPQDGYDPDAENTLGFGTSEVEVDESNFPVGKKFDLFCIRNKVYYEASVQKIKHNPRKPAEKPKVLFRFIGWGARYDELISIDSYRIQPHNLHTNPKASNPRAQEQWQGKKDLYNTETETTKKSSTTAATAKGKGKGTKSAATGSGAATAVAAKETTSRKRKPAPAAKKPASKASVSKTSSTAPSTASQEYADDFEDIFTSPEPPLSNSRRGASSSRSSRDGSLTHAMDVTDASMGLEGGLEQSFASSAASPSAAQHEDENQAVELEISFTGSVFDNTLEIDEISPDKRAKLD